MRDRDAWTVEFEVKGTGPFPFDMLRFDECWPATINDAVAIGRASEAGHAKTEFIKLRALRSFSPTVERWDSFAWHVVAINGEAVDA